MAATGIHIDLVGYDRLARMVSNSASGRSINNYMEAALHEEAAEVMLVSQELVPVRYGYLKASGNVSNPTRTMDGVTVQLYYGGPAAPYALYVHEIPRRHAAPTRSKFLELPMKRQAEGLGDRLLARIEHMFRSDL